MILFLLHALIPIISLLFLKTENSSGNEYTMDKTRVCKEIDKSKIETNWFMKASIFEQGEFLALKVTGNEQMQMQKLSLIKRL